MAILWCGGEDIDFQGGGAPQVSTTTTNFRSANSRCAISGVNNGLLAKSNPFVGGGVSSVWMSCYVTDGIGGTTANSKGFGLADTASGKGILVGAASSTQLALYTYNGTTATQLVAAAANSLTTGIHRYDIQITGPFSAATVNVYMDGLFLMTFTGDISISAGYSTVDCVWVGAVSNNVFWLSEVIVANEDTRAFPGLATLALTGAGTTDNWTGSTFGNINGTSLNDTNPMSSNTNAQDSQFNITDLPSGSFVIRAVKICARAAKSASPAVTKIKLGYNDGGSVAFGAAAVAITTAYASYEQLDTVDPNGGSAWAQSGMNALQLDVQSAT